MSEEEFRDSISGLLGYEEDIGKGYISVDAANRVNDLSLSDLRLILNAYHKVLGKELSYDEYKKVVKALSIEIEDQIMRKARERGDTKGNMRFKLDILGLSMPAPEAMQKLWSDTMDSIFGAFNKYL